jgi:hypothetical protein
MTRVNAAVPRELSSYAKNFTSSELICSARVHSTPWGPPLSSTKVAFLIIFACLLDGGVGRQDAIGVAVQNERR